MRSHSSTPSLELFLINLDEFHECIISVFHELIFKNQFINQEQEYEFYRAFKLKLYSFKKIKKIITKYEDSNEPLQIINIESIKKYFIPLKEEQQQQLHESISYCFQLQMNIAQLKYALLCYANKENNETKQKGIKAATTLTMTIKITIAHIQSIINTRYCLSLFNINVPFMSFYDDEAANITTQFDHLKELNDEIVNFIEDRNLLRPPDNTYPPYPSATINLLSDFHLIPRTTYKIKQKKRIVVIDDFIDTYNMQPKLSVIPSLFENPVEFIEFNDDERKIDFYSLQPKMAFIPTPLTNKSELIPAISLPPILNEEHNKNIKKATSILASISLLIQKFIFALETFIKLIDDLVNKITAHFKKQTNSSTYLQSLFKNNVARKSHALEKFAPSNDMHLNYHAKHTTLFNTSKPATAPIAFLAQEKIEIKKKLRVR